MQSGVVGSAAGSLSFLHSCSKLLMVGIVAFLRSSISKFCKSNPILPVPRSLFSRGVLSMVFHRQFINSPDLFFYPTGFYLKCSVRLLRPLLPLGIGKQDGVVETAGAILFLSKITARPAFLRSSSKMSIHSSILSLPLPLLRFPPLIRP